MNARPMFVAAALLAVAGCGGGEATKPAVTVTKPAVTITKPGPTQVVERAPQSCLDAVDEYGQLTTINGHVIAAFADFAVIAKDAVYAGLHQSVSEIESVTARVKTINARINAATAKVNALQDELTSDSADCLGSR